MHLVSPPSDLDPRLIYPRLNAGESGLPLVPAGVQVGLQLRDGESMTPIPYDPAWMPWALDNLCRSPGRWYAVDTVPGMVFYHAEDGMAAERLLLIPELWPEMPVGGLLASVPATDRLLVLPLQSYADVATLEALAQSTVLVHNTDPRPLSRHIYWYDGKGWDLLFVHDNRGAIDLHPPGAFLENVERLMSISLQRKVVEA